MANVNILTESQIQENLKTLPGWTYKDDPPSLKATAGQGKISKQFEFGDFMESLNFINKLAPFCEQLDHHPDVHIFYNKVLFELQRFDVGGKVTDKDFLVAGEIERLFDQL